MIDEQKAALDWLALEYRWVGDSHPARTIRALLAEPRLPKEPSGEALRAIYGTWETSTKPCPLAIDIYRALYAHLTAPKVKSVWMVGHGPHERVQCDDALSAMQIIDGMLKQNAADIRIERREVPA